MLKLSRNTLLLLMFAMICPWIGANAQAGDQKALPKGTLEDSGQQVIIRARLVEINRTKMRKLGVDYSAIEDNGEIRILGAGATTEAGQRSQAPSVGLLDALCKNGIARIVANPTIVALDGRQASLSVGSKVEFDPQQKASDKKIQKFIGTKLDVTTNLLEDNRIQVEIRLACSSLGKRKSIEPNFVPQVHVQTIDTGFEGALGETFTFGGLIQKVQVGEQTEERELVLLVTPELFRGEHSNSPSETRVSQTVSSGKLK